MISVVIPLYNKSHTIVNTLSTVINQIYTDFEIVIVDDGSTDNGVNTIVQHFSDPRIRIINQPNAGVSAARNRGVKESIYKYVAFLDADDEWHPDYLSIMAKTILQYPNAALYCSGGIVHNADGSENYRIAKKYINYIGVIDFFENPSQFAHTSGTVINKDFFIKTVGFPPNLHCLEDFALFVQLALKGDFVYVGLPISKYVGGVSGQITSASGEKRFNLLSSVSQYYNFIFQEWKKTNKKNKTFKCFIKYDIRHKFKVYIKQRKYIDYFFNHLDNKLKEEFTAFELKLYCSTKIKTAYLWINITKIIWRLHRHPVVGERVNINKIPMKYRKW